MANARVPRIAFVGWNPFQYIHALDIARALPGSVMVVESREGHLADFPEQFLMDSGVPVVAWPRASMYKLDGVFDVIVCQTIFTHIERMRQSKIAMLQYGLAKEPHNHGAWRSLADLCLVYGPYTAAKMQYFCPVAAVGNPRFDAWGTPAHEARARARYGHLLDPAKKTLLYAPTWGPLSTQEEYLSAIVELARDYNVLLKLHHNTDLLEHERGGAVAKFGAVSLGANDDLLDLLALSDVVLSDYSGAIFDALYCRRPVILLQQNSTERFGTKLDDHSLEFAARDRIGPSVAEPSGVRATVEAVLAGTRDFAPENERLVSELFVRGPGSTERARDALLALARGEVPPLSQMQEYVREEVRRARALSAKAKKVESSSRGPREAQLLESWLHAGHYERVMRYVELRSVVAPKLYLYRNALRAAAAARDETRLERLAGAARKHFGAQSAEYESAAREQLRLAKLNPERAAPPSSPSAANAPKPPPSRAVSRNDGGRFALARSVIARGKPPLARALVAVGRPELARSLLEGATDAISPAEQPLLLAQLHRERGDDLIAFQELSLAQRYHPGERRLIMRLAELLRDDGQWSRAHAFFLMAGRLQPESGTARLLSFESDMGWYDAGRETLQQILALPAAELLQHISPINRVSVFYPEQRATLEVKRAAARDELRKSALSSSSAFEAALRTALVARWLDDVEDYLKRGRAAGFSPSTALANRIGKVRAALGPLAQWVEPAWTNEHAGPVLGVRQGQIVQLDPRSLDPERTVEMFLPTPFFAFDHTEKPTYETVRTMLRLIATDLAARPELTIIPRLQLNWRHVEPRTQAMVVSYHTHAPRDARRLHVQEAPLSGYCSFDSAGFAGFATLAEDFAAIEAATQGLDGGQLEANWQALHARYVQANVSKYQQSSEALELNERYVFVPLQVSTDIVSELAFLDGEELLREVVAAHRDSGVRVVVKRHPYCHSMGVQKLIAELVRDGQIVLSTASVHTILARAEAVYTVNSGVGLEALLHMKPVITTGKSDYAFAAREARSAAELRAIVHAGPVLDRERTLRFLYYYARHYLVPAADPAAVADALSSWLRLPASGSTAFDFQAARARG